MSADTCFCGLPIDNHPMWEGEVLHQGGTRVDAAERCPSIQPLPVQCDLPHGHSGAHHITAALPVGAEKMIDEALNDLEQERVKQRRVRFWSTLGMAMFWLAATANLISTLTRAGSASLVTAFWVGAGTTFLFVLVTLWLHDRKRKDRP